MSAGSSSATSSVAPSSSGPPQPVCGLGGPANPLARWPAEGNALDSAGPHHGTLAATTFGSGLVGSAFNLDGVSSYVSVPDGIIPNVAPSFAVTAWINLRTQPGPEDMKVYYAGTGGGEFQMAIQSNHALMCGVHLALDGQWYYSRSPAGYITLGDWHHVGCVRRGGSLEAWVDGVLRGGTTIAFDVLVIGTGTRSSLGVYNRGNIGLFNGLMDEVRVYQAAPDATQMATAMEACVSTCTPPGTVCGGACLSPLPETGCGSATCDPCALANITGATCTGQMCDYLECQPGWLDTDGVRANGCEEPE